MLGSAWISLKQRNNGPAGPWNRSNRRAPQAAEDPAHHRYFRRNSLRDVLRRFPISTKVFSDRYQSRIKRHAAVLNRGLLIVVTPARGLRIVARRFRIFVKTVKTDFIPGVR